MIPGISTSQCSITHRLKEGRSNAGKENFETKMTFLAKEITTVSCTQIEMNPKEFQAVQTELDRTNRISVVRRPACPVHEIRVLPKTNMNKVIFFLLTIIHFLLMMVFVFFPPWPPLVFRKLIFRAPPRGQFYHLIYGEGNKSTTTFFARQAKGQQNLRLCLPLLINKKVNAIDVFYHALRTRVAILKIRKNINICAVHLQCDLTRAHLGPSGRCPFLIIFFQPNSSDLGACLLMEPNFADIADFFWMDMLFFDYPGFGVSDGHPSEYNIYRSTEVILEYAKSLGYLEENIILMGFSLGTAAAVHLASITPKLGALILMAPFTSLCRVFINLPNLERSWPFDLFRSIDKASAISCPTLVCHGTKDYIVRIAHGKEIAKEIQDAELFVVEDCSHQNLLCNRAMWDKVNNFLQQKLNVLERWGIFITSANTE